MGGWVDFNMIKNITTILLLIGSLFALDIEDKCLIFSYNSEENNFMAEDSTVIDISVPEFISTIENKIEIWDTLYTALLDNIKIYNSHLDEYHSLKKKYDAGTESLDGSGKIIIADKYLIECPKCWYNCGGIFAAAPIILYLVTDDLFYGEEEENDSWFTRSGPDPAEEKFQDKYFKYSVYGMIPGAAIYIMGYIGSKIKLGHGEKVIKHSEMEEPKLLFFNQDEIEAAIKVYNRLIKP